MVVDELVCRIAITVVAILYRLRRQQLRGLLRQADGSEAVVLKSAS